MKARLEGLNRWRIGALAAVLLIGLGASYLAYWLVTDSDEGVLDERQQLIPVTRGNLVNDVSINGSVAYPNSETLSFEMQGRVGQLLVEEGEAILAGLPLATIDAETVTTLEKAVAEAQVRLRDAQEALDSANNPYSALEVAEAESDVADLRVALAEAMDDLAHLVVGPSEEDVAEARSQVASAERSLANARLDLEVVSKEEAKKVVSATEAADAAAGDYRSVFLKWLGIAASQVDANSGPAALLDSWGVDLESAFDDSLYRLGSPPKDDPATAWSEVVVYSWLVVYPGSVMATCSDAANLASRSLCVSREMDEAWERLGEAVDTLGAAEADAAKALSKAEEDVDSAEGNLEDAQAEMAALVQPQQLDVEAAQKSIRLAQARLDDAILELEELQAGPDPLDVALRTAEVASAQASLDSATETLQGASLTAPWDGIVSSVNVEVGQSVNAGAAIVDIVDPTVVEIEGAVDEIDVLLIRQGARASVTMDALAGQRLEGIVSELGSVSQNQPGVVTYPISVQVRLPAGLELPEGLSAVATVILREETDVLLVPIDALYGSFDTPTVRVAQDGRFLDREVVLGSSDGFWVVVREGLAEGEMVVMEATESAALSGFEALRGITVIGGGFGGGRRPGGQGN